MVELDAPGAAFRGHQSMSLSRLLRLLLHHPRLAAVDEFLQTARPLFGDGRFDLRFQHVFVSVALDGAEDADGLREVRVLHARGMKETAGLRMNVVASRRRRDPVLAWSKLQDARVHANAAIAFLAEDHRLAVFR